uniref:Uncharacterized protein n=1 Tax=Timema monikensis TaxID=170555 RepID=A0A7R9EJ20_9NEOP|nr:unnamed protein product [Timema monikensis]
MVPFESKLNCEVLWDDLALEVRWAVAGDSVVMQLVSKLVTGPVTTTRSAPVALGRQEKEWGSREGRVVASVTPSTSFSRLAS